MGIQIKGSNDTIQAADGNLSIEGVSLNFTNENVTGISTMATGHITGTTTLDDDLKVGISTLFVDKSAGLIGIGTITPTRNIHIDGTAHQSGIIIHTGGNHSTAIDMDSNRSGAGSGIAELNFKWNGTTVGQIGAYSGSDTSNKDNAVIHFGTASAGSIIERLRIDSDGRLLLGVTSADTDMGSNLQVAGSSYAASGILQARTTADGNGPALDFIKSRNTTWGSHTIVQDGDELGRIYFRGDDGVNYSGAAAAIFGEIDGTPGADDLPGRLVFYTSADGADSPTERLRITSAGALLIGTTSSTYASGDIQHEIKKNNSRAYTAPLMTAHSHLLLNNSDTTDKAFTGLGFRAGSGDGSIGYIYRNSANNADFVINTDGNSNGVERLRVYNNGAVLIGAHANEAGGNARLSIDCEGLDIFDGVGDPANYGLIFANDPTSDKANGIGFFNDSASTCGGYIVHQDKGSGNIGDLVFGTSASSDTPVERMRIDKDGRMIIVRSGSGGELNSNDAALHVNAPTDGGQGGIYVHCNSQSGGTAATHYGIKIDAVNCANNANLQAGLLIDVDQQYTQAGTGVLSDVQGSYSTQKCFDAQMNKGLSAVTNAYNYYSEITVSGSGGTAYHMYFNDTDGSNALKCFANGNIQNKNNSYGSTSDVKLKENIVDAGSQWEDIKAVKVRNFNFKADPDTKMLGVVAQEVETVSPGLVHTENDIEVNDATGEGTITGTTKSVKYSILYMKAIKALQEAMTRIETLETKVAALESA